MTLAKIVYASLTGNTEDTSEIIEDAFTDKGIDVQRVVADDEDDPAFFEDADICVIATYTYDDGVVPDELLDFFDDLQDEDLSGKVYGVAGTGDSDLYPDSYCTAVDLFEQQFEKTGAKKGADSVKIENDPDADDEEKLKKFVDQLIEASEA